MVDPLLGRRSVIILEQIHVRSLWGDALLGAMKMILPHRKDLRLVLSIAPSCAGMISQLQDYFRPSISGSDVGIIPFNIEDAKLPVETLYLNEACTNYFDKTLEVISDLYNNPGDKYKDGGDFLVFMPTKKDVESLIQKASNEMQATNAIFMPYYSSTSINQYQALMNDDYTGDGIWRIIVATDIADEDFDLLAKGRIIFIIDTGLRIISETNLDNLLTRDTLIPISVARAESRRLMASNGGLVGKCYRLYTEEYEANEMPKLDFPESFYVDLTEFSLRLMSLTIPNVATDFPYFPPSPPMESLSHALEKLYYMNATNTKYELTQRGIRMADSHLPVMLAGAVAAACELNCAREMLSIAGMVLAGGIDSVFFDPSGREERNLARLEHEKFQVKEGDYMTLLNIYECFKRKGNDTTNWARDRYLNYRTLLRAQGICTQLQDYLQKQGTFPMTAEVKHNINIESRICQSICAGYFLNAAKRTVSPEGSEYGNSTGVFYQLLNEKVAEGAGGEMTVVEAHATSVQDIEDSCVVYERLVEVTIDHATSRWYMKGITSVKNSWLLGTNFYKELK